MTFRNRDGGFGWWKGDPSHLWLSAYTLEVLTRIKDHHTVDAQVVKELVGYLTRHQYLNGRWKAPRGNDLEFTAWISEILLENNPASAHGQKGLEYLKKEKDKIDTTEELVSLARLLARYGKYPQWQKEVLAKLITRAKSTSQGHHYLKGESSAFPPRDSISLTARTIYPLLKEGKYSLAHSMEAFLLKELNGQGIWSNTQSTLQALKALVLLRKKESLKEGTIEILLNHGEKKRIPITAENLDIVKRVAFSPSQLGEKNRLEIRAPPGLFYQVNLQYYQIQEKETPSPYEFSINYGRKGKSSKFSATAHLQYTGNQRAFMVIGEIALPPGADINQRELNQLVGGHSQLKRWERKGNRLVFYLDHLPAKGWLQFSFTFRAPGLERVTLPSSVVYEYYAPHRRAKSAKKVLTGK